jgi:hypothetical protein
MNAIRFRVFRFVIGRFGSLRKVWILTQAFDLGLGLLTLVTSPSVFFAIVKTRKQIAGWPGIRTARHRLGGTQFNLDGTELGHIHSNGVADIALTSTEQANVLHKQRAQRHHTAPKSTWVSYFIERKDQEEGVISLFRIPFERLSTSVQAEKEFPSEEYVQ